MSTADEGNAGERREERRPRRRPADPLGNECTSKLDHAARECCQQSCLPGDTHLAVEKLGREPENRTAEGVDQQELNEIVEGEAEEAVDITADDPAHPHMLLVRPAGYKYDRPTLVQGRSYRCQRC